MTLDDGNKFDRKRHNPTLHPLLHLILSEPCISCTMFEDAVACTHLESEKLWVDEDQKGDHKGEDRPNDDIPPRYPCG
jgi:hypothetical protein